MNLKKTKKYIIGTFLVLAAFAMQLVSPVIIQAQKKSNRGKISERGSERENATVGIQQILDAFARQGNERRLTPRLKNTLVRFLEREDIRELPLQLQVALLEMVARPHTYEPQTAFSEADTPSQLVQYFLMDTTQFEPNVFTAIIPGINDGTRPTAANAANGQLPTVGVVRTVVEPKPGFPTDPNDPRTLIDMFADVSGLFVINNESGWYEGWIIRDIKVRLPPRVPTAERNTEQ